MLVIAGIVCILIFLLFDIAWFSFSVKNRNDITYEVTIRSPSQDSFVIMIPSIVNNQGYEIEATNHAITSIEVDVNHMDTQFGYALKLNLTGSLDLRIECSDCSGLLSMNSGSTDEYYVFAYAVNDFSINLSVQFSYDHYSEKSNLFGITEGGWGGCIDEFNASNAILSKSNWTILEGVSGGICYDGFGSGFRDGLIISIVGYSVGLGLICYAYKKEKTLANHIPRREHIDNSEKTEIP